MHLNYTMSSLGVIPRKIFWNIYLMFFKNKGHTFHYKLITFITEVDVRSVNNQQCFVDLNPLLF